MMQFPGTPVKIDVGNGNGIGLGSQIRKIAACLSDVLSKHFYPDHINKPILITRKRERRRGKTVGNPQLN